MKFYDFMFVKPDKSFANIKCVICNNIYKEYILYVPLN